MSAMGRAWLSHACLRVAETAREKAKRNHIGSPDLILWWADSRDVDGNGLVSIIHGWESGMDASPAYDDALHVGVAALWCGVEAKRSPLARRALRVPYPRHRVFSAKNCCAQVWWTKRRG